MSVVQFSMKLKAGTTHQPYVPFWGNCAIDYGDLWVPLEMVDWSDMCSVLLHNRNFTAMPTYITKDPEGQTVVWPKPDRSYRIIPMGVRQ